MGGDSIVTFIQGHYHMWFILMIIGVYMCIPIIRGIVENEFRMKYYLILSLVFEFIIPQISVLINDFGSEALIKYANAVQADVKSMSMNIVLGYVSYFILF